MEREYSKVWRALECIMPVMLEKMGDRDFRNRLFEKRKEQMLIDLEDQEPISDGSAFRLML